jgi:hypothetical protein
MESRYKKKFSESSEDGFEQLRKELKEAQHIIYVSLFDKDLINSFEGRIEGDFRNGNYIKLFSKGYECRILKHKFKKYTFNHQTDDYEIILDNNRMLVGIK